jgi:predicted PurR-regulated permease PerM
VALAVVGYLVLVPVALYYLLMDAHRWSRWAASLVPPRMHTSVFGFARECDELLSYYLRGQVLVMLALAVYYAAALMIVGFDLALPVGLFTGLAIFVPYLGFGVGLVLALLAGVLQFGPVTGAGLVLLVYGAGQLLESFVLTPRWVGERIGLSPLAVIFALLAFGQLLGFVGVLVALPASAVLLVLLRRAQALYFDSKLYRG